MRGNGSSDAVYFLVAAVLSKPSLLSLGQRGPGWERGPPPGTKSCQRGPRPGCKSSGRAWGLPSPCGRGSAATELADWQELAVHGLGGGMTLIAEE